MLDTLSKWKRKFSSSTNAGTHGDSNDFGSTTHHHPYSGLLSNSSAGGSTTTHRPIRNISQPIPRSSPSSLSGSFVGGLDTLGNNNSSSHNINGGAVGGNVWQEQMLSEIEDNRPMGAFGRRRRGSVASTGSGSGLVHEVFGGSAGENGGSGTVDGVVAPAVVGLDSVPPQQQQQQMYAYPYQSSSHGGPQLRVQTNVRPQPPSQPTTHHNSNYLPPHHQQMTQPDINGSNTGITNISGSTTGYGYVYHPHTAKQLSPIVEQDYITPTSTTTTTSGAANRTHSASLDYQSLKKAGSLLGSVLATPNSAISASGGRNSGSGHGHAGGALRDSGSVVSGGSGSPFQSGGSAGDGATNVGTFGGSSRRQSGMTGGTASGGTASGGSPHAHSHYPSGAAGGSPATPATAGTIGSVGTTWSGSGTAMIGGGTPTLGGGGYIPPQHANAHLSVGSGAGGGGGAGDVSFGSTSAGTPASPLSQYATPTSHTNTHSQHSQSNWSNPSAIPSPAGAGPGTGFPLPPPSGVNTSTGAIGGGGGGTGTGNSRSVTPETSQTQITRPAAVHAPFLSRPLNRSVSQGSSKARGSNTSMSTIPGAGAPSIVGSIGRQGSIKSVHTSPPHQHQYPQQQQHSQPSSSSQTPSMTPTPSSVLLLPTPITPAAPVMVSGPPTIPPLDLRPPFPGPHPSTGLRPPKRRQQQRRKTAGVGVMPKIPGSHEGCYDEYDEYKEDEDEGEYDEHYEHDDDDDDDDDDEDEDEEDDLESAPGEEVSTGYEYGYGYGYGHGQGYGYGYEDKTSEMGRTSYDGRRDTMRYADEVRRSIEAGPSRSGIIIQVDDSAVQDLEIGVSDRDQVLPNRPSASESFITRRWNRDHIYSSSSSRSGNRTRNLNGGQGGVRNSLTTIFLRAKTQQRGLFGLTSLTPAFWAFWLGFICPVLWLVGGWHFTSFGEMPPRMSFWEFYFSGRSPGGGGGWREAFCCCLGGRGRKVAMMGGSGSDVKGKGRDTTSGGSAQLPRWITEKQSSDDGRARLNDTKRSMRGISYGYPFIARANSKVAGRGVAERAVEVIGKPNRVLDQLYGVKLREVRGRPESGRRKFDPWIQRCRYAFCYVCVLVAIGLCTASMYLIVFNTRQLR